MISWLAFVRVVRVRVFELIKTNLEKRFNNAKSKKRL